MKKIPLIVTTIALALPLVVSAPLAANAATSNVTAAKKATGTKKASSAKTYTYTVSANPTFYKPAKAYHTKDATPYVFKGNFMADQPIVTMQAKTKLKSGTTYYVTQSVKVQNKAKKNGTFLYVKGQGWIASSKLTPGKFVHAD
ncbi:hypothetical protein [Lentilactobacillus sp. SPB1-3]|uniref:Uncharacterized protein n=1 Tax=Lentilactobacillus terminaliae TaxID=3003483 RepID=A0ACD5DDB6_9LACO|nr:hypothetical protein [Lentilactobacillus sp. SPB1-3]MCZ0977793.1 hypothetical protein [Lentilactobacillus sp. SPB1-3]